MNPETIIRVCMGYMLAQLITFLFKNTRRP